MKAIQLLYILLLFPLAVTAQSGSRDRCMQPGRQVAGIMNEAPDITITTTDGITRNLYSTLDSGKTVFIDLFYTTCYYCQLYAPIIEEVFQNTGAGDEDIEFWGISNNLFDTNSVIDEYKASYNVNNPCAGPWGGGLTAFSIITEGQNFQGFPTYCIVCPDRTMYFDVCYPPEADCFNPYFENCTVGIPDQRKNEDQAGIVSVYPNPASDGFSIELFSKSLDLVNIEICNVLGETVYSRPSVTVFGFQDLFIPASDLPDGFYFIKLIRNHQMVLLRKVLISR